MLKRLLFGVALFLMAAGLLALVDYGAGRLYPWIAPESGRAAVASLLGDDASKQTGYYLQHPYLHYANRPYYTVFNATQFNARGHRGDEVAQLPEPGFVRILAIGGSTTVSFPYVKYPSETWAAQLETMLREKTGLCVEVINAGLNDANSADLMLHYLFRNRYLKPDIVVMHVGGNDGVALLFDDYNPEYTHYTHGWRNTSLAPRPLERGLLKSNLVKIGYAWWLRRMSLAADLGRDDIRSLTPEQAMRNARVHEPEGLERNLDVLVRTIMQDQAVPVMFPFIWAPLPISRQARYYGPYAEAMICGFEKDCKAMEAIGRKYGLTTVRMPSNAIPDGLFVDFCHVNLEGETIKARYVAETLVPVIAALNRDGRFRKAVPEGNYDKKKAAVIYQAALARKNAGAAPEQQRAAFMEVLSAYPHYEPALQALLALWLAANEPDQAARVTACLETWFQPAMSAPIAFTNGVRLLGVSFNKTTCEAGGRIKITYFWQCAPNVPADNLATFVHITNARDRFQDDRAFLSGIPRKDVAFQPFPETFAEERVVSVPAGISRGKYSLWLGLYDRTTGERVGLRTALVASDNAVEIPFVLQVK